MNDEKFEAALIAAATPEWIEGFKSGWGSTGEGYNAEWPDEGVPWERSAGREAMLRILESRVRGPF